MHEKLTPEETVIRCHACGHENPASHRFCGTCGATLEDDDSVREDPGRESNEPSSRTAINRERETREFRAEAFETSISNPNELSLFRSFRPKETSSEDDWGNEPSHRRRIYIGMLLALIIGGLAYGAWRKSHNSAQNSQTTERRAAAASQPVPATTPTRPSHSGSDTANKTPAANNSAKAQTEPVGTGSKSGNDVIQPRSKTPRVIAPAPTTSEDTAASPAIDNGTEELAMAQRYLGGASGQGRDSAEAAKWLWKSIAKHNSQATVLLADLYLKGDGVSKNCDQARILLDSAARKGVAAAGERLRNLQAFGCQ